MIKLKALNKICFTLVLFIFSGCISLYPRFEKIPCTDLGDNPKEDLKKIALSTGFKEKDIVLTNKSIQYTRRKTIVFSDISKAIVVTKRMLKGKRYTIVTVMKNKDKHAFETYDFNLAIKVYSALECFAGIKPNPQGTSTDKYDRLAKLKALLDSGAINNEEYEREKEKILNSN